MSDAPIKIAIIGAGLTGLVTAHGLLKAGFSHVTLYDSETSLDQRRRDWPLLLHWALPAFNKLVSEYVVENFPDALCNRYLDFDDPETCSLVCRNGMDGTVLFKSSVEGMRRVSRRRLRGLLVEGLDKGKGEGTEGRIKWGKKVESVEVKGEGGKVELGFADGTKEEVDYVLGTDGAWSKVRDVLFGGREEGKVKESGFVCATGIVRHGDKEKVQPVLDSHPMATVMMGTESVGGVSIMYADNPEDISNWAITWIKIWRREKLPAPPARSGPEALTWIKETTKGLADPFQSQINWTESGDEVFIDEMHTWTSTPWETMSGRVTLAGDAAHPMLVYRGQGFQHAVTDAENFIKALVSIRDEGANREEAIRAYSDDAVERGAKAVEQSLKEADLSMDLDSVMKMMMAKKGHAK